MKNKTVIYDIALLLIGLGLIIPAFAGKVNEFWNGMGSALAILGALRLLKSYRLNKNEAYREKKEIETSDERNQFLRSKAWAWSGYLFLIISGLSVIIFKLAGQDLLSMAASGAVCLMLVLHWGAYLVLRKKY